MSDTVEFREDTASEDAIRAHLEHCDARFSPRLSGKVNIGEYARKIAADASTFEAWSARTLVGLVAAYLNDDRERAGYITSVSVLDAFARRGIASRLLDRCLERSRLQGMSAVSLEVGVENPEAIRLYEKFGFRELERRAETVTMKLTINEDGS